MALANIPTLAAIIALSAYLLLPLQSDDKLPVYAEKDIRKTKPFYAPKQNIWSDLTADEAADSAKDNFIFFVEALRPNKTDAVPYVYGDGDKPERWAKAAISQSLEGEQPCMVYYQVGPLPITKHSKILPLEYILNSGKNFVANPVFDFNSIVAFAVALGVNISDITQDLLGAKVNPENPLHPEAITPFPRGSRVEAGGLKLWMQFFRAGMGSNAMTLLPQGMYVRVDATHLDPNEWTADEFYYNGLLYENEETFRKAWKSSDFVKTPANLDGDWTQTEDFDSHPDGRELPPPLDRKQQFVAWFGFEFYITTSSATGISLYDVRFKGERVMYELGMQEALAHYAGEDPMSGGQEFLDTFFGMGARSFELVPGYDCPAYADFLDLEWHQSYKTNKNQNSICLFEYTADYLLSRHTAEFPVTASRNTYLVLRWVSTTGNYDYTFEYIFYLDGTIEVKVRASGFIFGAFYRADNTDSSDEYGHRVQNALSSSMHDHVINFKADMDVAGLSNDFVRLAIEPQVKSYPWDKPEQDHRHTMHLKEYQVSKETALEWPKNAGEYYLVYSDEENAWGERKGYRIAAGTGMGTPPHLTIQNSTQLGDSARWAEHDLWVLRRKDTEPRAADPLNWFTPHDPLINFSKFVDGESLSRAQEDDYDGDLVVYFNLGSHHVPHSGDIPNTLMHTSSSGVMFVPHNFHDRDPSRASVQGVRLQLKGRKDSGFFGGGMPWDNLEPDSDDAEDLRVRSSKKHDTDTKAYYFGQPYEKDLKVPLDGFEPNLVQQYKTERNLVTDLTFNGSAAGAWE